jgi:hypothetical protein
VIVCILNTLVSETLKTEFAAVAVPSGGTIFEGLTNLEQSKVSKFPSGNSKTNTVYGRWAGFRNFEGNINKRAASDWCLLSCKVRTLRSCRASA